MVDKYIGDAIMAVFGAPVPQARRRHERRARRGRRCAHALAALNERLGRARHRRRSRPASAFTPAKWSRATSAASKRMEYTVIGDAVNLASRLESSTKELGVGVLISEDTYQLTKDNIVARPVKEIHVKGRDAAGDDLRGHRHQGRGPEQLESGLGEKARHSVSRSHHELRERRRFLVALALL